MPDFPPFRTKTAKFTTDPSSSCSNGLKGLRGKASARLSERLVVSHTLIVGHGPNFLFFTVDKA